MAEASNSNLNQSELIDRGDLGALAGDRAGDDSIQASSSSQSESVLKSAVGGNVATAVAEPPAVEDPPLSRKERKARAKAEKLAQKTERLNQKAAEKKERQLAKANAREARWERRRNSLGYRGGILALRLLGLGIAGSLAAVGGITVASFISAPPSEDAPLLERGLDGTSDGLQATQKLPRRLLTGLANRLDPTPQPQLYDAAPPLSEAQRQQLAAEATALRQELAQINLRASALEQQLGYDYSAAELEQRLAAISQTVSNPGAGPNLSSQQSGRLEDLLMILPTDPLFEDAQSALKPGSTVLLGTLLEEMRPYERAIVTVRVHTDDVGTADTQRDLSLRRAQVVVNYLRSQITPSAASRDRFIWNPVGVGSSQPLAPNDGNENRQRNRRIEITVTSQ